MTHTEKARMNEEKGEVGGGGWVEKENRNRGQGILWWSSGWGLMLSLLGPGLDPWSEN